MDEKKHRFILELEGIELKDVNIEEMKNDLVRLIIEEQQIEKYGNLDRLGRAHSRSEHGRSSHGRTSHSRTV